MPKKSFIKIENEREWEEILKKSLFKTFFHSLEWERFLESNFKWLKFERYIWKDKALLSLGKIKVFRRIKLISHPFCEYGGPLPLKEGIDLKEFQSDLFSFFKNYLIKIRFHPEILKYFSFENKFETDLLTFFVKNGLNFKKRTKYEIKKAQRQKDLLVEKCNTKKDLEQFYKIYIKSEKKHGVPFLPYQFFEYFLNNPSFQILLCKFKKKKVIAGSVFLFYDKFCHYFKNAIDPKYKKLGGNYLILWEMIKKHNNLIFDLGGTRRGTSLEIFKRGWGGREQSLFEMANFRSFSKLKFKKIIKFLPISVLKYLSPYLLKYKF